MNEPRIPGHRSHEEIMKSAAGLDTLRNAGVPSEVIGWLLEARQAWWGNRAWPPLTILSVILAEPRVKDFDEMLYAAIRKRVREATRN